MKKELFPNGAITLSFDDGWECIYKNAFPILKKAKLKSTFYVITGRFDDKQFPRYVNAKQVKNLSNAGHEVACHTAAHLHLPNESDSIIEEEIILSKKYLAKLIGKVDTFAYPYGEYDSRVIKTTKKAGFIGARSVIRGFNDKNTDVFLLNCQAVKVETQFSEVKEWIDYAITHNKWLILMFHQIDHEGRAWSTTPEMLKKITDYLLEAKIKVITIREGIKQIKSQR